MQKHRKSQSSQVRVLVVSGGPSTEREVSLLSGKNVFKSLDRKKYIVENLVIPKNLEIFYTKEISAKVKRADVVFIAMHGTFGEDGKLQSYLDSLDVKYTGSNALASAAAMNKFYAMQIARTNGVNVPKTFMISKHFNKKDIEQIVHSLKFPFFLKPNNGGSSDGAGIIKNMSAFKAKLKQIFLIDNEALAQEIIKGREVTCAVLGNAHNCRPLLPAEIPMQGDFFDKKIKYSDKTIELCPAPLSPKETSILQELSCRMHIALGCNGVSRSDFIYTSNRFYYLETNTIPGMTANSLVPKEAHASGMTFSDLLNEIISCSLA